MKYYTGTIPPTLAEKLKEKGMHQLVDSRMEGWLNSGDNITYAECFDWLMSNRRITIVVEPSFYEPYISKIYNKDGFVKGFDGKTWHEAAEKAIEKASTLI